MELTLDENSDEESTKRSEKSTKKKTIPSLYHYQAIHIVFLPFRWIFVAEQQFLILILLLKVFENAIWNGTIILVHWATVWRYGLSRGCAHNTNVVIVSLFMTASKKTHRQRIFLFKKKATRVLCYEHNRWIIVKPWICEPQSREGEG